MKRQRGSALLLMLLVLGVLGAYFAVRSLRDVGAERDRVTAAALAQAKEALIGYATRVDLSAGPERPGDLPCPDDTNTGVAKLSCGNASGSTFQDFRLGRLPWKTLGLPDLRDGSGERLWYAVSNNFKNNTRTLCTLPGMAGCLNSDTVGTITIRDSTGSITHDGTGLTGAIAVIIAPGSVLTRQDGVIQVRDAANANISIHYLDVANGEDNADFVDSSLNGFINAAVRDAGGNVILNDRVLAITYDNLMPVLEQRVAREALNCLRDYASDPLNQGRLPWAADMAASASGTYFDATNTRFGRLPNDFEKTVISSGGAMKNGWTTSCTLNATAWWRNWSELVFYAVADAYKPQPIPHPSCGTCLTVNPPSAIANKQAAVVMARRRLAGVAAGQPRTSTADKGAFANYLENQNATPADDVFEQNTLTPTFNDATSIWP